MRAVIDRLRREDVGFTLIEVVISVVILGIISGALIGIVLEYFKVTSSNRTRLSESTDQQFISAYWQQDVSSLGRRDFTPASATDPVPALSSVSVGSAGPAGCGSSVGAVVVAFSWNEYPIGAAHAGDAWTPSPQEVAYVTVGGASGNLLKRVRCGSVASTLTIAHHLVGSPLVTCAPSCTPSGSLPRTVSMKFTSKDTSEASVDTSYTTTVTADRRQG